MDDPEIVANLWYVFDELGIIYSLRGRAYVVSGTDEEKLAFLRKFAETDYLIAQPFPVPERLHTTFVGEDGRPKLGVADHRIVHELGGAEVLFKEVLVELENQLPIRAELSIGRAPLICITPLLVNEHGKMSPIASPSGLLRSLRNPMAHEDSPGADLPAAGDQHGTVRATGRPRPDLVAAAMSAQGGQIPLERDTTFRLQPSRGDYLLCIRCNNPFGRPPEFGIVDFWEFRGGDRLLITNREEDYPAAAEQMEEGGPSLWKILPGDRLTWVGWRGESNERKPTLVALVNCQQEGYVYGEPASPALESVISFGAPTSEATPEIRSLWMVGYDAAVAIGLPRTWKPPA